MKRPVPVVLTAILLGLFAALDLLGAAGMAAMGFVVLHKGLPGPPPPMPFPPSFLPILFFGMSLAVVAMAGWVIFTLIGLVRLRSWARYSVLVIAGLMAGFGAFSMVISFAMPYITSSLATQPGVNLGQLRLVFLISGILYGIPTAIGIAWLIYFNRANTRAVFLQDAPVNLAPPNTSTGRVRPTAITVISWLYLFSWPFCLIYAFFPFPAFLFGFILYGLAARCIYAFYGIVTFAIGYGLYRLWEPARIATFVMFAFLPIQTAVLLTPWGSHQFRLCMDAINANMYAGQQVPPSPVSSPSAIAFLLALTMAFYAVALWLLHRHRVAFTPAPPPPPMPPQPEALTELTP